jgi:hypothetical protein
MSRRPPGGATRAEEAGDPRGNPSTTLPAVIRLLRGLA